MDTKSRYIGCALGQAIGDSVGFLVERAPQATARAQATAWIEGHPLPVTQRDGFSMGQVSDDTQMFRELLRSLITGETMTWNPTRTAEHFANLKGTLVGGGGTTHKALDRIRKGGTVFTDYYLTPASNGAAMRAAAVGLAWPSDTNHRSWVAVQQAQITHNNTEASDAAVLVASTVARNIIDPDAPTDETFLRTLGDDRRLSFYGLRALNRIRDVLGEPRDRALAYLSANLDKDRNKDVPADKPQWDVISPSAFMTVGWALWCFLTSPDDFRKAIHNALWAGGDVDTTAALTGAFVGSRNGTRGQPDAYADLINDRGDWTRADLTRLAEQAWSLNRNAIGDTP